jgi:hypothetical protein
MSNVDIFSDGKLQFDKPKADPKPDGVYIGRKHKHLGYGQTGYALWDSKWNLQFYPDGEQKNVCFKINKKDFWWTDKKRYCD